MASTRLLERIATQKPFRRSRTTEKELYDSIADNVLNILRTANETVVIRDDFGMPAYSDIQNFDQSTSRRLIADISYQINEFEKRLNDLQITCNVSTPNGILDVVFLIEASYKSNDKAVPFKLQLSFGKRGQFNIKA